MRFDIRPSVVASVVGLQAQGGIRANQLSWESFGYRVAVYGNTTNNRATASRLGITSDNVFTHMLLSSTDWYYWVRGVDAAGRETGIWNPSTATAGVTVTSQLTEELDIAASAVSAAKLKVAAIDSATGNLKSGTVNSANIVAGAITSREISATYIYAGTVAASNISAGQLSSSVIYAGNISADKITSGTFSSGDGAFSMSLGKTTFIDGLGAYWSIGGVFKRTANLVGPAVVIDDVSSSPSTYPLSCYSASGGAAKFAVGNNTSGTNVVWITGSDYTSGRALKIDGQFNTAGLEVDIGGGGYGVKVMAGGLFVNSGGIIVGGASTFYGDITLSSGYKYRGDGSALSGVTASYADNAGYANQAGYATNSNSTILLQNFPGDRYRAVMQSDGNFVVYDGNTSLWNSNQSRAQGNTSDIRLKKDIEPTKLCGIELTNKMRVVDFDWIDTGRGKERQTGLIAQEIEALMPGTTDLQMDNTFTLQTFRLVPVLIKAVQELGKELAAMKQELGEMKEKYVD
jgi:hypothetical protein